jgi:hypothetical protein
MLPQVEQQVLLVVCPYCSPLEIVGVLHAVHLLAVEQVLVQMLVLVALMVMVLLTVVLVAMDLGTTLKMVRLKTLVNMPLAVEQDGMALEEITQTQLVTHIQML